MAITTKRGSLLHRCQRPSACSHSSLICRRTNSTKIQSVFIIYPCIIYQEHASMDLCELDIWNLICANELVWLDWNYEDYNHAIILVRYFGLTPFCWDWTLRAKYVSTSNVHFLTEMPYIMTSYRFPVWFLWLVAIITNKFFDVYTIWADPIIVIILEQ